jgi:hypothetical protein
MLTRAAARILLLLPLAACAVRPEVLPLEAVVPDGTATFALEVIPRPVEAELEDSVARIGSWEVTGGREGEPALDALGDLARRGSGGGAVCRVALSGLPGGTPEEYSLSVRRAGDGVRVDLAGADPAGRHWAAQSLRQLVFEADGALWIRLGRIRDRPGFPLRGSKRPLPFEAAYRANLDYEARSPAGRPGGPREHVVAVLSPGGELDATEGGIAAAERFFREWHARGAKRFAIEFDDVRFGMTPATRDRFGWYPNAIGHYLRACRARLREVDPDAVLYWLPQTYFSRHPLFRDLARDVGRSGGLPPGLGLVLTGPEVVSAGITAEEMRRALADFGLAGPLLLYDNRGREEDHGPLLGRDPGLVEVAEAVFGERGEVLNRITRLDYAWNPGAYEPARSHLLACREIVGPAAARPLSRLVLGSEGLTALEALHLYRAVARALAPSSRRPADPGVLLPRIWQELGKAGIAAPARDRGKTGIVDTHSQTP